MNATQFAVICSLGLCVALAYGCTDEDLSCIRQMRKTTLFDLGVTDEEFQDKCQKQLAAARCGKMAYYDCTIYIDRYEILHGGRLAEKVLNEICQSGTDLNKEYNKHSACLSQNLQERTKCFDDFDEELLSIYNNPKTKYNFRMNCCAIHKFISCSLSAVQESCTQDAVSFLEKQLLQKIGLGYPGGCEIYFNEC